MHPTGWTSRDLTFWGFIACGFPSPAEGYEDHTLDLNAHIIRNPAATFFYRVKGDDLQPDGILDGSILIVDRSVNPRPGRLAVVEADDDFIVERLTQHPRIVFGVVTACVTRF